MIVSWRWLFFLLPVTDVQARLLGIPTVPFSATTASFPLKDIQSIVVDSKYASKVDEKGQTLIPPKLQDFAATFASDLNVTFGVALPIVPGNELKQNAVLLTIGEPSKFLDSAGHETSEGYDITITTSGITITGASPLGVWWGTRTLFQQFILSKPSPSIPYGSGTDAPGWGIRGMMLDAGRHYYPPGFLTELCAYMSMFKQNTLHLHLSDNLYANPQYSRKYTLEQLYARFRLWSDSAALKGLARFKNESYTKDQFDVIQSSCAARGVTILPEIEAPGHALPIVQWKPELGLTDLSLLNISHPATIPTVQTIWGEFLPWFHVKTVHIGADEYTGPVADYNRFVNAIAGYIGTVSGKFVRIWGTFPPKPTYTNIYKNVSIQHWEYFEDNPNTDYIQNGYSVLNSDDTFYVVNKYSGSYPPSVPISKTFSGNPGTKDKLWYPYVFNTRNASDNPVRTNPLVLGSIAPLWNDYGPNSSTYSEAYYAWKEGIPALGDKQWGGNITATEFPTVLQNLLASTPGQNLERRIPSKGSTILDYSIAATNQTSSGPSAPALIADHSGNGYDGSTTCMLTSNGSLAVKSPCSLRTPLSSKGRDYTLTLTLLVSSLSTTGNATLLSGPDSSLLLTPQITLLSGGNYYRLSSTVPLNRRISLSIIGQGNQTFARIDDGRREEFQTRIGVNGDQIVTTRIAIEAPLSEVVGEDWSGELWGMKLIDRAQ